MANTASCCICISLLTRSYRIHSHLKTLTSGQISSPCSAIFVKTAIVRNISSHQTVFKSVARSAIEEGSVTGLIPSVESLCTPLTLCISSMCSSVEQHLLLPKSTYYRPSSRYIGTQHAIVLEHLSGLVWRGRLLCLRIFYSQSSGEDYHPLKLVSSSLVVKISACFSQFILALRTFVACELVVHILEDYRTFHWLDQT